MWYLITHCNPVKKIKSKPVAALNSFKFTSFAISGLQANVRFSIHSGNDAR